MRKLPWVLWLTVLSTGGCAVGPDFNRPETSAGQTYTAQDDALPADQKIALGQALQTEWWTLFACQPLNDTIGQALQGNYDLAAARAAQAQAEEAVKAASGAYWPQVTLSATAGRQKYGAALFGPAQFVIPPFTYYEAGPGLAWTPDLFGGTRRRVERQKALADYQKQALDAAYVTLTGDVTAQALEMAAAKAEIAATRQILAEDDKTLRLTQAAFQAGSGTQVDILAAQRQLDADRAQLPPLEQRLTLARHALAILLGRAPSDWTPPDFTLDDFTLPQELPVSLPSALVRQRPDILATEANLHAASANIGVATANLYPNITLSANLLQEALTVHGLLEGSSDAWALAAGISLPVFSGGTLSAEKRAAERAYEAALAQYRETILRAFGQVADTLTALAHDSDGVNTAQQAERTAGRALALAQARYQAGAGNLLQVQDAQRQQAQAELMLIGARQQRYLDTTQLFVALGGSPMPAPATQSAQHAQPSQQ